MAPGAYFRQLRQSKLVTLADLAADTGLTPGFISRFERGQADISITNFMALLTALNVALSEFESGSIAPQTAQASREEQGLANLVAAVPFMADYFQVTRVNSPAPLAASLAKATAGYRAAPTRKNHFVLLFYQAMTAVVAEPQDTETMTATGNQLTRYLLQVENWGVYECQLFELFTPVLPATRILQLLKTGMKKTRQLGANAMFRRLEFAIQVAALTSLMANNQLRLADSAYRLMKAWQPHNASEALAVRFFGGWLAIRQRDSTGVVRCQAVIAQFQALGMKEQAADLSRSLQHLRQSPESAVILMNYQI